MTKPPLQMLCVVLALVLFGIAAYTTPDRSHKLTCAGLAALTLALVL